MAKMSEILKVTSPLSGKTEGLSIGGFLAGVIGVVVLLAQVALGQKIAAVVESKTKLDTSPNSLVQAPAQASAGIRTF